MITMEITFAGKPSDIYLWEIKKYQKDKISFFKQLFISER